MAPLLSVIMATYGRGAHIRPSIVSALRQTYRDFELIVVGDGCTGAEAATVAAFGSDRLSWIPLSQNSGSQAAPNNAGMATGRGEWIAYLGHDDIWSAQHLEHLVNRANAADKPDFVVSVCLYHGPPSTGIRSVNGDFAGQGDPQRHFFPPSSFMHRRELGVRLGGFRDPRTLRLPDDADFVVRAAQAGARFASTRSVTVHKLAAGHRYLAYLQPDSSEQEAMLRHPRVDRPEAWSAEIETARRIGGFMTMGYPDNIDAFEPGELFAANRSNKGLARPALRPLDQYCYIEQTNELRALDWYPLEPGPLPFRWSGPSAWPKILLPVTHSGEVRIALRCLGAPAGFAGLAVYQNGSHLPHRLVRRKGQTLVVFQAALAKDDYSVLQLHTKIGQTDSSKRPVGVALAGIGIDALSSLRRMFARARPRWFGMGEKLDRRA